MNATRMLTSSDHLSVALGNVCLSSLVLEIAEHLINELALALYIQLFLACTNAFIRTQMDGRC